MSVCKITIEANESISKTHNYEKEPILEKKLNATIELNCLYHVILDLRFRAMKKVIK